MMYPFLTLNDDTEITHSEMKCDGRVKVYIEKLRTKNIVFDMQPVGFQNIPGNIFTTFLMKKSNILKRLFAQLRI